MLKHRESAFTLMELVVTMAVVGILMAMSSQVYQIYKRRAYGAAVDALVHNVQVALEAGRIDSEQILGWHWFWTDRPGPVNQSFLPGLINEKNTRIWVRRDTLCELGGAGDWSMMEWVMVQHCRAGKWKTWWRTKNGLENSWEWQTDDGPIC